MVSSVVRKIRKGIYFNRRDYSKSKSGKQKIDLCYVVLTLDFSRPLAKNIIVAVSLNKKVSYLIFFYEKIHRRLHLQ